MDTTYTYPKVTRVEIIDETGRAYVRYGVSRVMIATQDEQRTLKVFLTGEQNEPVLPVG